MVSVVESTCGSLVYMGSNLPKKCPTCKEQMFYSDADGIWFAYNKNKVEIPLLTRHKFQPTELKYFSVEEPALYQKIMVLMNDYRVILNWFWQADRGELNTSNFLAWKPIK